MASIPGEMAINDFNNQSTVSLDHQRCGMTAGDQVADQGLVEISMDVCQINFPEPPWPVDHRIGAPDAVDQHIEAAGIVTDPAAKLRDLLLVRVIDLYRNRLSAGLLDERGGLVDSFGASHALGIAGGTATRAVDKRPRLAQGPRDSAAGAPGCARDQNNLTGKRQISGHRRLLGTAPAIAYPGIDLDASASIIVTLFSNAQAFLGGLISSNPRELTRRSRQVSGSKRPQLPDRLTRSHCQCLEPDFIRRKSVVYPSSDYTFKVSPDARPLMRRHTPGLIPTMEVNALVK